jgi:hypothetical protein
MSSHTFILLLLHQCNSWTYIPFYSTLAAPLAVFLHSRHLLRPQQQQYQQQCQPALQQQCMLVATSAASAEVEAAPAAAAAAAAAQPTANLVTLLRSRGLLQDVTSEDLEKVRAVPM